MTTGNGALSGLEVLDARRGLTNTQPRGVTNTPPLGETHLGHSPERPDIIARVFANPMSADLSNKDIVPLDGFEDVESGEVSKIEEQEFIQGIAREIKLKMSRDPLASATHTIEASFKEQEIVVVVGPKSHEHQGKYGCGKIAKASKKLGPYAVFGNTKLGKSSSLNAELEKSSSLKEFVHKIFFGLPKAFLNVQTENMATQVEIAKKAPAPKQVQAKTAVNVEIATQVPAPKPKKGLLARIFSCFCFCFGRCK